MSMMFRSFFPTRRSALIAALAVAATVAPALRAQDAISPNAPAPQTTGPVTGNTTVTTDDQGHKQVSSTVTFSSKPKKKPAKVTKEDRVQQTKDTKADMKRIAKYNPLIGKDAQLPDKQLYDKALAQTNTGHFDIARLDLQTLLNTYPDSQYLMRAKLAVADAWYKEGGSTALIQAEQEYKDFITFFPNVPEAAEAQLRVGDIYFKQMDVPDRDYSKGMHAEEEYRTMLKQYPDAPPNLLKEARQKLREVQEVLAEREAELGAFYATRGNWPASIARYQTVVDTYPLYSHMDDVLTGLGDAYEAEAKSIRSQPVCTATLKTGCIPEAARARVLEEYDGKAAGYYRKVVLEHAAAPHVEDAKERLAGMDLPVPTPTPQQLAASEELEGSRAQYNLQKRLEIFLMHKPDTVTTAQVGDPPLEDAAPTTAPAVLKSLGTAYVSAFNPNLRPTEKLAPAPASTDAPAADTPAAPATAVPAAPLALSDVPAAGQGGTDSNTTTLTPAEPASSGGSGTGIGAEILSSPNAAPASNLPAATGAQDPNYGLKTAAPKDMSALPPIEKPADAPDQVNEAEGKNEPPAQTKDANGKKPKNTYDKSDESSSKKKPKKGIDKLNPF